VGARGVAGDDARRPLRSPALDGLRGLAILLVFAFHYGGGLRSHRLVLRLLGQIAAAGWTGLVLFFALSGFLITSGLRRSFAESRPGATPHLFRRFYGRRARRILPLYALALTAALLSAALAHRGLTTLGVYALFLQDLPGLQGFVAAHPTPLPLYHLWTLAVEEQFYLLWPPLLLWSLRRARARPNPGTDAARPGLHLCLAIFAAAALFRLAVYGPGAFAAHAHLFDKFLLTYADSLALGAALALGVEPASKADRDSLYKLAFTALLLGVAVFLAVGLHAHTLDLRTRAQFILGLPAVALAATALIALNLRPGLYSKLFSLPPLPWLGRISYGVYIFHILLQPFFSRLARQLAHAGSGELYQTVRLVAALAVTLPLAWLSFRFLERPLLQRASLLPTSLRRPRTGAHSADSNISRP